jgi:hypothetical protein
MTVVLVGGLGNQLFTYYAVAGLARKLGVDLRIDDTWAAHGASIRTFGLPGVWVTSQIAGGRKFTRGALTRRVVRAAPALGSRLHYYESPGPGFDEQFLTLGPGMTVRGYFQSWRHVQDAYDLGVPRDLTVSQPSAWLRDNAALAAVERPIGVHVRRGDYAIGNTFGLVAPSYYRDGIQKIRNLGQDGPIWLFSDEPDVARQIVPDAHRVMRSPVGPHDELLLMSKMTGFVTANSSFSWWGAWLTGSSTVVSPYPWFKATPEPRDLIPPSWHRLAVAWTHPASAIDDVE